MYLANLYVSFLDLIADGIEASLDVLSSLVKSGFLCQGNCTSIVTKDFHWTQCIGMAILSMDLDTQGYPTRLGKGMERISAHGSVDVDTHEQPGWAWL